MLIGAGQFGLLFIAMRGDITPGLASLVIQVQAFFTIGLAAYLSGERVRLFQVAALLLACSGIVVILAHTDATTTPLGLALVLLAALCWAGGNVVVRSTPDVNMLAYVVWASLFSALPLYALSLAFEGWPAMRDGHPARRSATWGVVAFQAFANTLFGYAAWGWLLGRYPAATIAPMALLVPVFGMGASAVWLGEPLQGWKLAAAALVMAGLAPQRAVAAGSPRCAAHALRPRRNGGRAARSNVGQCCEMVQIAMMTQIRANCPTTRARMRLWLSSSLRPPIRVQAPSNSPAPIAPTSTMAA